MTADERKGYEIRFSERARKAISEWIAHGRQLNGPEVETGGLLFGERDDALKVIWISDASGPPPDSIAREDLFVCGTAGTHADHLRRKRRSRGSEQYVGMWHTHPRSAPEPSGRDLRGMQNILDAGEFSPSRSLLTIVGTPHTAPQFGTFVFDRDDVPAYREQQTRETYTPVAVSLADREENIGLALSGGGSRAIAFHLGCLRALNDLGILKKVRVISGVSGGAVLAALYAYSDDSFSGFESRVRRLLSQGLQLKILRRLVFSIDTPKIAGTLLTAGLTAGIFSLIRSAVAAYEKITSSSRGEPLRLASRINPPLSRWSSRTTAFEKVLRNELFGNQLLAEPKRSGLDVVLNATEMRTGTAFRFGSARTSSWRHGDVVGQKLTVATAVAASAAYPALLPALDRSFTFAKNETLSEQRVILSDGGIYDNLGTTCLEPGRDPRFTSHVYDCDRLISCSAGHGQLSGTDIPFWWPERMRRSIDTLMRKSQDGSVKRLFDLRSTGRLQSLVMPYLGQQDSRLISNLGEDAVPGDFVRRETVMNYPTDFRAMSEVDIDLLFRRGEQLTRILVGAYWR